MVPKFKSYEDITKTDFHEWRGKIDVLTGGFPCQPFSYAGKRGGREDERYLWPQMLRVIDEVRPTWVVGENVAGLATMVEGGILTHVDSEATLFGESDELHEYNLQQRFTIERICTDLEQVGYSVQPMLIPAAAVGAPHQRDRIFILAHVENAVGIRCGGGTNEIKGRVRDIRDTCTGSNERFCPKQGDNAANSDRDRGGEIHKHVQSKFADGAEPFGNGGQRNAADATSEQGDGLRYEFKEIGGEEQVKFGRSCGENSLGCAGADLLPENRWEYDEFGNYIPPVPPVHRGYDGIPIRLDDLTISFAKWRRESLKAYGNAIVPQVMFRIFQAIEFVCLKK